MPVVFISAICPGEADAFLPEHLQDFRAVAQPSVVAPGPGQSDALHAKVLRQERAGLVHLSARLLDADATHDANRSAILDIDRLQELMGVGVLLDIEE